MNAAQSLPNLNVVHKNLKNVFLVVLDHYFNLTTGLADVVLPTPILFERDGTITTGERRVRLVRKVVNPPGMAKPEWLIFKEFSKLFQCESHFHYKEPIEITKEIVDVVPAYR